MSYVSYNIHAYPYTYVTDIEQSFKVFSSCFFRRNLFPWLSSALTGLGVMQTAKLKPFYSGYKFLNYIILTAVI